jgi:hypothetical protein
MEINSDRHRKAGRILVRPESVSYFCEQEMNSVIVQHGSGDSDQANIIVPLTEEKQKAGVYALTSVALSPVLKTAVCSSISPHSSSTSSHQYDCEEEDQGSKSGVEKINCNGSPESIMLFGMESKLDDLGQRRAFEIICSSFVLSYFDDPDIDLSAADFPFRFEEIKDKLRILSGHSKRGNNRLRMFLTGAAGSGKSKVINTVQEYGTKFTHSLGLIFSQNTIRLTAFTGVAATVVQGATAHTALHLMKKKALTTDEISEFNDTRVIIIDEISFCSYAELEKIDQRLRELTECSHLPYGNVDIVFSGDFKQLEPIGGTIIYNFLNSPLWYGAINCFKELQGSHRFDNDPEWGQILLRMSNGELTPEDKQMINTRQLKG